MENISPFRDTDTSNSGDIHNTAASSYPSSGGGGHGNGNNTNNNQPNNNNAGWFQFFRKQQRQQRSDVAASPLHQSMPNEQYWQHRRNPSATQHQRSASMQPISAAAAAAPTRTPNLVRTKTEEPVRTTNTYNNKAKKKRPSMERQSSIPTSIHQLDAIFAEVNVNSEEASGNCGSGQSVVSEMTQMTYSDGTFVLIASCWCTLLYYITL